MLVEFEVGNFRSFRDPVRLSLVAAKPFKEFEDDNVFQAGRFRLLKSAAVYGANASGKSNLLNAFVGMRRFVLDSSRESRASDPIPFPPFYLDDETASGPTRFEVVFLLQGITYRYGFEADVQRVRSEWLFRSVRKAEHAMFLREGQEIHAETLFEEGRGLEGKTRPNALFLSVVAQFNGTIATSILQWFEDVQPLHGIGHSTYLSRSVQMIQDEKTHSRFVEFLRASDLAITDLAAKEEQLGSTRAFEQLSDEMKRQYPTEMVESKVLVLESRHAKYRNGIPVGSVGLDFVTAESAGTRKLFNLAGTILDCLDHGRITIADELDSQLHPLLSLRIVSLFNSRITNPRNAQIVFSTHDTNLLQCGRLRRDQVWFVEKNAVESSDLFSLAAIRKVGNPDAKSVRKDASFRKDYIEGRYGAIPYLGDFEKLLSGGERDGKAAEAQ